MQSLSFPENRFVTSGTERQYYRWRRSVHQTTRPACMARPDPLWGRSCQDFSTLRDRRGSCGYRGITGACEDACPESPKDHEKRISTDISNGNDQLIYTERTADFYFRDSNAPPTRNEDSARKRDRFFEMASRKDPWKIIFEMKRAIGFGKKMSRSTPFTIT